jgi:hypothetical protein
VDDLIISSDGMVKEIILSIMRLRAGFDKERVSLSYRPFEVTHWGLAYNVTMEELRSLPEFHYQEGQ